MTIDQRGQGSAAPCGRVASGSRFASTTMSAFALPPMPTNVPAPDGAECISFEVTNIALADTLEIQPGAGQGWNVVAAHVVEIDESTAPRFRRAVVQVRRVSGYPQPAVVTLQDSNFLFVE